MQIDYVYAIWLEAFVGMVNPPKGSGDFNVKIDPIVQIDPAFMVYYNGQYVPGTELYSVTMSEGFAAVPLPGAVWLFGSGLAGLAGWKRFREDLASYSLSGIKPGRVSNGSAFFVSYL